MMLVITLMSAISLALGQDYAGQFRTQFATAVVPPFNQAVSTYQVNILQHIATVTAEAINKDPSSVAKDLNCNTNKLLASLKTCVGASDQLKTKLDQTVVQLTQQGSSLSTQLTSLNKQLTTDKQQLTNYQNQLNAANAQLQQAQTAFSRAQQELNNEQKRYDDARNSCIGKRGFFHHIGHIIRKVTKPIRKPIEKAICHVVNHDGINRAKDARNRAQNDVNNCRNRVNQLQAQVNQKNAQIANENQQIAQVTAQQNTVTSQLNQVKSQQAAVVVVNTQVKSAEAKVSTFLGSAQVLKTVIDKMVDFNGLLVPLRAISTQLKTFNQQGASLAVPPATINKVTANLKLLQAKLPSYPFVENVPGC